MRSNHLTARSDALDISGPAAVANVSAIDVDLNSSLSRLPNLPEAIIRVDKVTSAPLRQYAFEGGLADAFEFGVAAALDGYTTQLDGLRCIVEDCLIHPISGRKDEVISTYDGGNTFSLSALGLVQRWRENFPDMDPNVLAILCGAHEAGHKIFEDRGLSLNSPVNALEYHSDPEEDACWKHAVGILKLYWPDARGQLIVNGKVYSLEEAEKNTLQRMLEPGHP